MLMVYGMFLEIVKSMKIIFALVGFFVFLMASNCQIFYHSSPINKLVASNKTGLPSSPINLCDTVYYDEYLSIINKNKIINVEKLVLNPPVLDTIMINGQESALNKIEIFDDLEYYFYTNTGIKPNDDYEYFLLGNSKIYIDLVYYKMLQEDYAFRSIDIPTIYKFQKGDFIYYAVFLNNFSCGIAHGNTLFLFSNNVVTKESQLVFYSLNQVSSGISCFGYDEDKSTILYYDWDYVNTVLYNKKNLTIYRLSNGKLSYKETMNLNITVLNNWRMIFCNE